MGKAFWNEDCHVIAFVQLECMPLQKSRRSFPDIDGDIKNPTAKTSDQFRFSCRGILKMQAANGAFLFCIG